MKKVLLDFSFEEIEQLIQALGEPRYRAAQLFKWLHAGVEPSKMSNLPKSLLQRLEQEYCFSPIKIERQFTSKDKSSKFLFSTQDGHFIEGMLMHYKHGSTMCVSTQIGCRMNCAFCASSLNGLERSLSAGEILGQVTSINHLLGGTSEQRLITNIVLMGSGEPLDNYDNVVKFLSLATCEQGINFSARNISLSTCGLVPQIIKLAELKSGVNLSISLHATTDEVRSQLIPIAKKYPITDLIDAAKYYFDCTGRRVYFEYILISNLNSSAADAARLAQLTSKMSAHINLIMLNPVKERPLTPCTRTQAQAFLTALTNLKATATLRRSMGSDIEGACGQLRNLYVGQKDPVSSAKKP